MNKLINVNGIAIRYQEECNTKKPKDTIIFLHGWGGSSNSWELNIKELRDNFDCIAIDFPGFGISDEPRTTWGVEEYALFIKNFAEILRLKKFTLVGKSFGGRIGIYYASKWPKTLNNLILVSSAGIEKPKITTNLKIVLAKTGKWLVKKTLPEFEDLSKKLFCYTFGIKPDKSNYKWKVKKLVTRRNLTNEAKNIYVPTLIVWGKNDDILPIKIGQKLHNLIKSSKFVVINGKHNAHHTSANEFNKVLKTYL